MKNKSKFLIVLLGMLLFSNMVIPKHAKANEIDIEKTGETIKEIAEAVADLFCPETAQNRCKKGTCQSGACISFRSACGEGGSKC